MGVLDVVARVPQMGAYWIKISEWPENHLAPIMEYQVKNNSSFKVNLKTLTIKLGSGAANESYWWGYEVYAHNGNPSVVPANPGTWKADFRLGIGGSVITNALYIDTTAKVIVSARGSSTSPGGFYAPTKSYTFTFNSGVNINAGQTASIVLYASWSQSDPNCKAPVFADIGGASNDGFSITYETPEITLNKPTLSLEPSSYISVGEIAKVSATLSNNDERAVGNVTCSTYSANLSYTAPTNNVSTATLNTANLDYLSSLNSDLTAVYSAQATRSPSGGYTYISSDFAYVQHTVRFTPRSMVSNGFSYSFKVGGADLNGQSVIKDSKLVVSWSSFYLNKHLGNFNYYIIELYNVTRGTTITLDQGNNDYGNSKSTSNLAINPSGVQVGDTIKFRLKCTHKNGSTIMNPQSSAIFESNTIRVIDDIKAPTLIAPATSNAKYTYCNRTPKIIFMLNSEVANITINYNFINLSGSNISRSYSYSGNRSMFNTTNGLISGSYITFKMPDEYASSRDKLITSIKVTLTLSSTITKQFDLSTSGVAIVDKYSISAGQKISKDTYYNVRDRLNYLVDYYKNIYSTSKIGKSAIENVVFTKNDAATLCTYYNALVDRLNPKSGLAIPRILLDNSVIGMVIIADGMSSSMNNFYSAILTYLNDKF